MARENAEKGVTLTIELTAKPEKNQELYQALEGLLPLMRTRKGCRSSRIYRGMENDEVFFLTMEWEDRRSLERYVSSAAGAALLGGIDLLSKAVRVRIGDEEESEGTEALKKMRTTKPAGKRQSPR